MALLRCTLWLHTQPWKARQGSPHLCVCCRSVGKSSWLPFAQALLSAVCVECTETQNVVVAAFLLSKVQERKFSTSRCSKLILPSFRILRPEVGSCAACCFPGAFCSLFGGISPLPVRSGSIFLSVRVRLSFSNFAASNQHTNIKQN